MTMKVVYSLLLALLMISQAWFMAGEKSVALFGMEINLRMAGSHF
jgi:hypothetical protein